MLRKRARVRHCQRFRPGTNFITTTNAAVKLQLGMQRRIPNPARRLFVLVPQQTFDSFLAGRLTEEAIQWPAKEQQ